LTKNGFFSGKFLDVAGPDSGTFPDTESELKSYHMAYRIWSIFNALEINERALECRWRPRLPAVRRAQYAAVRSGN
jgi:hypothetical protein